MDVKLGFLLCWLVALAVGCVAGWYLRLAYESDRALIAYRKSRQPPAHKPAQAPLVWDNDPAPGYSGTFVVGVTPTIERTTTGTIRPA